MDKIRFKEALLEKKEFLYTLELVPRRGSRGKTQDDILKTAEEAARTNLVHAVSITDNPGGHPALSPDVIGLEISRLGTDPIVHFTCKGKNRNQIESILYSLDRIGISNLLVMTGDFPLYEVAFLYPQSQCPKYLFNGQCGGSFDGWCEVFPEKRKCIYVRGYDRLKPYGEKESLGEGYTPPRDWALDQTSSWANYFLGRDHHAGKIG